MKTIMANGFTLRMRDYLLYKSIFLIFLAFLVSCSATNKATKAEKICTEEFRMIRVQFKDTGGRTVAVTDFRSINKRTNLETIKNSDEELPGYYTVASDADLHSLSAKGDIIQVSARHPETNTTISSLFVIKGGKDACHVEKLSGPEVITIN